MMTRVGNAAPCLEKFSRLSKERTWYRHLERTSSVDRKFVGLHSVCAIRVNSSAKIGGCGGKPRSANKLFFAAVWKPVVGAKVSTACCHEASVRPTAAEMAIDLQAE
jgi:hypothetical protein